MTHFVITSSRPRTQDLRFKTQNRGPRIKKTTTKNAEPETWDMWPMFRFFMTHSLDISFSNNFCHMKIFNANWYTVIKSRRIHFTQLPSPSLPLDKALSWLRVSVDGLSTPDFTICIISWKKIKKKIVFGTVTEFRCNTISWLNFSSDHPEISWTLVWVAVYQPCLHFLHNSASWIWGDKWMLESNK